MEALVVACGGRVRADPLLKETGRFCGRDDGLFVALNMVLAMLVISESLMGQMVV